MLTLTYFGAVIDQRNVSRVIIYASVNQMIDLGNDVLKSKQREREILTQ